MQLIYRGQTIEFKGNSVSLQKQLYAVNWRFQVLGITASADPVPMRGDRQSHVINWRFRMATEV